jgi:hypothetical protein
MTKPERITFIPPQTTICKADFSIVTNDIMVNPTMEKDTILKNVLNQLIKIPAGTYIAGEHKGEIYYKDTLVAGSAKVHLSFIRFSKENSPISFRSFITYSTDEKFLSESYVKSQFYVAQITRMPVLTFNLKKSERDNNRNFWAAQNAFYVYKTPNNNAPNSTMP